MRKSKFLEMMFKYKKPKNYGTTKSIIEQRLKMLSQLIGADMLRLAHKTAIASNQNDLDAFFDKMMKTIANATNDKSFVENYLSLCGINSIKGGY